MNSAIASVAAPVIAAEESSFCCCDWRACAILASIVIAIAGLVASIMQVSILGMLGFLSLGVCTLIFRSINNEQLEKIEQQMAQSAVQNVTEMNGLTSEMNTQLQTLQQDVRQKQDQITRLEADISQRQQIQHNFEAGEMRFRNDIERLTQTKADLERDLATREHELTEFQRNLQEATTENTQLTSNISTFQSLITNLERDKRELENQVASFQRTFEVDLAQLNQQIDRGKEVSKELVDTISVKNAEVEKKIHENLDESKKTSSQIKAEEKEIEEERIQIENLFNHIQAKTKDLDTLLESEKEAQHRIDQLEQKFTTRFNQLNQLEAAKIHLIKQYDTAIAQKQQELQQKLAQLKPSS